MIIFKWLNDQLLRMEWLSELVRIFVSDILRLDVGARFGASIHFFIYDVTKIFILLTVLIFCISWVQSYFPPERSRKILSNVHGIKANIIGALLGTVTPFCSCSSIPLFIGFVSAGLPIGVTFSFLISSPLVDLASVILLASIFNWSIAIAYVFIGVLLAVIGGTLISRANMEKYIEEFVLKNKMQEIPSEVLSFRSRLEFSVNQVIDVFQRVWLYVLIGVAIGAAIHNWIPDVFVMTLLGKENWWSVPMAVFIGFPMYADIFGALPIAEALVKKGVGLGTALAFMMSVTALSIPSLIMLKKVIKTPLILLFIAIVAIGIILIGYLFNSFAHLFI